MPKGYWVAHVDVEDMDRYKEYVAANAAPFAEYGARFLVRGGGKEVREGKMRLRRCRQCSRRWRRVPLPVRSDLSVVL